MAKKNNLEQVVVSKVMEDRSMIDFLDGGITALFFTDETWQKAWSWIYEYQASHGSMPVLAAFMRAHPNIELLTDVEEPCSGLVDELIERRRRSLLFTGLQASIESFSEGDVEEAVVTVTTMMATINTETSRTLVVRSTEFIGPAVRETLTQKSTDLLGIPTGFPTIDESTGGMQNEQFIVLIANPKNGKSTVSLQIAINAQKAIRAGLGTRGYRGLYLTFEMSNQEVIQRYQSLGAQLNLTAILRGQLSAEKGSWGGNTDGSKLSQREALREFEMQVLDLPDLTLVHDVGSIMTVGGIKAKLDQHQPDFLVIDGMYLMEDEQGEPSGSPRALTNITRSTKRLAQNDRIPILGTTQALLSKTSRRSGVQLGSIGYTSSFAQDADAIFGLDREDLTLPTAKLKVIAARNSLGVEVDLDFDYSRGIVEEIGGFSMFRSAKVGMADDD